MDVALRKIIYFLAFFALLFMWALTLVKPFWFYTLVLFSGGMVCALSGYAAWIVYTLRWTRPRLITRVKNELGEDAVDLSGYDLLNLPFPDGSLEAAFLNFTQVSVEMQRSRKLALNELKRVLKAGGRAAVIDPLMGMHTQKRLSGSKRTTFFTHCPPVDVIFYESHE